MPRRATFSAPEWRLAAIRSWSAPLLTTPPPAPTLVRPTSSIGAGRHGPSNKSSPPTMRRRARASAMRWRSAAIRLWSARFLTIPPPVSTQARPISSCQRQPLLRLLRLLRLLLLLLLRLLLRLRLLRLLLRLLRRLLRL